VVVQTDQFAREVWWKLGGPGWRCSSQTYFRNGPKLNTAYDCCVEPEQPFVLLCGDNGSDGWTKNTSGYIEINGVRYCEGDFGAYEAINYDGTTASTLDEDPEALNAILSLPSLAETDVAFETFAETSIMKSEESESVVKTVDFLGTFDLLIKFFALVGVSSTIYACTQREGKQKFTPVPDEEI
jgi:hypothetical protein